jgi:hypothetical protein
VRVLKRRRREVRGSQTLRAEICGRWGILGKRGAAHSANSSGPWMMVGRKSYFRKIENKRKQRFWPRKEGGLFAGQLRIIFIQPVQVPAFHLQVIFLLAFDCRS